MWPRLFLEAGRGCSSPSSAQWPLDGACPGLQVDGCDICGCAGLAGPLAAGAPGGFGRWTGGGLGSFPQTLPERSFNLLLTGPQAVLGTRGTVKNSSPLTTGSRCRERTPPTAQLQELGLQFSETGKRMWQEGVRATPASDTNSPTPTAAYHLARKGYLETSALHPPKTLPKGHKSPQGCERRS